MNPGPAMSIESTQRCTAACAFRASMSRVATSRGACFIGLASCIAAVDARSPRAACFGNSNAGTSAVPGLTAEIAAPMAASKSCLAWIIERILRGARVTDSAPPPIGDAPSA